MDVHLFGRVWRFTRRRVREDELLGDAFVRGEDVGARTLHAESQIHAAQGVRIRHFYHGVIYGDVARRNERRLTAHLEVSADDGRGRGERDVIADGDDFRRRHVRGENARVRQRSNG